MKILLDINHPAHVHFFKHPAALLQNQGHEILVTSREKDVTIELLDKLQLKHKILSSLSGAGILSLASELFHRNRALYRVVRDFKPDVMASIGGTFIAHVGTLSRTPSLVFYDTENAKLQNLITYPLATCVIVPQCYQAWLPKRHIRYQGYHELSYLHPNYFKPNKNIALSNGLKEGAADNFFIRLVSWQANHDIGERGWSTQLLRQVIAKLTQSGHVLISTEVELGEEFNAYLYTGNPADVHHVMAFCRAFIGESATMASECAVLGVPALYAAHTGRGYTDEQEQKYGLVKNLRNLQWHDLEQTIEQLLAVTRDSYMSRRQQLLDDCVDVAQFVADTIVNYPNRQQTKV